MAKSLLDLIFDTADALEYAENPFFYLGDIVSELNNEQIAQLINLDIKDGLDSGAFNDAESYLNASYSIRNSDQVTKEIVASCVMKFLWGLSTDDPHTVISDLSSMIEPKLREPIFCARLLSSHSLQTAFLKYHTSKAKTLLREVRDYPRAQEWGEDWLEATFKLESLLYSTNLFKQHITDLSSFHDLLRITERHPIYQTGYLLTLPQSQIERVRQPIEQLIFDSASNPSLLYNLTPREFESLIAKIWESFGFDVQLTAQTRDGGTDIICMRSTLGVPLRVAIEVKRYRQDRLITVDMIRSFVGANSQIGANKLVFVTTSNYTKDALKFAALPTVTNQLELKALPDIIRWANEYKDLIK